MFGTVFVCAIVIGNKLFESEKGNQFPADAFRGTAVWWRRGRNIAARNRIRFAISRKRNEASR